MYSKINLRLERELVQWVATMLPERAIDTSGSLYDIFRTGVVLCESVSSFRNLLTHQIT